MKATFENSVDVLVKAYLNGTLEHNNCYACAVGNLIAGANGYKFIPGLQGKLFQKKKLVWEQTRGIYNAGVCGLWYDIFITRLMLGDEERNTAQHEIESTGYTDHEVRAIERAFECASEEGDYMFNGLLAVVDVLAEIHNVDLTVKQSAVVRFEEVHATK